MKPSDHPDFFRLPPPPGRSRESIIVLDEMGRFFNGPQQFTHEPTIAAFSTFIRRHPDDGRYILTNGYDWTYFTVRDTPFFVRRVGESEGKAILELFDGTTEPLDPSTLRVSAEGVLFARVKNGEFEAKFLPSAQVGMVDFIAEGEDGSPFFVSGDERYPIPPRG